MEQQEFQESVVVVAHKVMLESQEMQALTGSQESQEKMVVQEQLEPQEGREMLET